MQKFEIAQITVARSGQVVQVAHKFNRFNLNKVLLVGIDATCNATPTAAKDALCRAAVAFNGGKEGIFQKLVRKTSVTVHQHFACYNPAMELLPLYATGYIEDLGKAANYPYTVNLYFQLSDKTC